MTMFLPQVPVSFIRLKFKFICGQKNQIKLATVTRDGSQASGQLIYWIVQALGSGAGGFSECSKDPRVLVTNKGKVIKSP